MKKKVRLTPELEAKYRAWLQAQKSAGLTYSVGEEEAVMVSEPDTESVRQWMREANIASVEFEEGDEDEDDDATTPTAPQQKIVKPLQMPSSSTMLVVIAIGAVALVLIVVYLVTK